MCAIAELDEVPLVAEPYELTAAENRIGMFLSQVNRSLTTTSFLTFVRKDDRSPSGCGDWFSFRDE